MSLNRRRALGVLLAPPLLAAIGTPALGAAPPIFAVDGVAIRGIDPVAYFTQGRPVPGEAAYAVSYGGADWHFISDTNRAAFVAEPEKFGAQFGGYCAYAASKGYLAPTVPEAWTVYKDRLYLNANLRARELWLQDIPGNIAKGRNNWPGILG